VSALVLGHLKVKLELYLDRRRDLVPTLVKLPQREDLLARHGVVTRRLSLLASHDKKLPEAARETLLESISGLSWSRTARAT